jgi:lipoprotein-anchoring transpeptidase ErfK/SrfK
MRLAASLAVVLALTAAAPAGAATVVRAWFPQGSQLRYGVRAIEGGEPVLASTLRSLLAGPNAAERRGGARTAFARGTRLLGLRRQGGLVTIQLDRRFLLQTATGAAPVKPARLGLRMLQLGRTLSQFEGVQRLRISVSGHALRHYPELDLRWRPDADGTWRLADLTRVVAFPVTARFAPADLQAGEQVRFAQTLLAEAGWRDAADVNGTLDYTTSQALTAFQAWTGLDRDGTLTAETLTRIARANRPEARVRDPGRHIEVYRDLGVLLLVENGQVIRAVHTSTGAYGRTPAGTFHVYRKERLSWSVPFKVWMPWASYFYGGLAMHAYPSVPAYPASHGCVRLPSTEAERVYAFAESGTSVYVY